MTGQQHQASLAHVMTQSIEPGWPRFQALVGRNPIPGDIFVQTLLSTARTRLRANEMLLTAAVPGCPVNQRKHGGNRNDCRRPTDSWH